MTRYIPTLLSIRYPNIPNNKIEQLFCSKIYPNKITSPKIHLAQIHLHIALVLPLRQHHFQSTLSN